MGKMHQEGVTLIELLVTLAIGAVLIAVGVPALRDLLASGRMSAAVNDVVTHLQYARSEAIKRSLPVRICPSTNWDDGDNATCVDPGEISDGWIVVIDPDGAADIAQRHEPLNDDITVLLDLRNADAITYAPDGTPDPATANPGGQFNLLLCDSRGDFDTGGGIAAGRWINIGATGRPRIYSQRADVQGMLGGC